MLIDYLKVKFQLETCSATMQGELRHVVKSFNITFNEKWKKASCNRIFFKSKNFAWLRTDINMENMDLPSISETQHVTPVKQPGCPSKDFNECGTRAKIRKVEKFVSGGTYANSHVPEK